jgi:acyl carrier protein
MGLEEKVIEAVAKVAKRKPAEVRLETSFEDLGMDSLDRITLLFELEQTFDISIPETEVQGIQTVGDVISRLGPYLAGTSPAGGAVPSGSPS